MPVEIRRVEIRLGTRSTRWGEWMTPGKALALLAMVALGLGWFVWNRYENVAEIFDQGKEGVLHVKSVAEDRYADMDRHICNTARTYGVTLDGQPLRLRATRMFTVGQTYPVVVAMSRLKGYVLSAPVQAKRWDCGGQFFVVGSKSESKWTLFVREIGGGTLALIVLLEAMLIAAAFWIVRSQG